MRMRLFCATNDFPSLSEKKTGPSYGPVQHITAIAKWIKPALLSAHLHLEAQDEMTPAADHPASPGRSAGVD